MIHPTAKASREPIAAAFSSQYDKRGWATEGSNPSLSTGESRANLTQNPSATRAASRERFRRYWSGIAVRDPDRNVIELRGREQGVVEGVTRYVP